MKKIFSIGMTKQAVLSKLDGTKATAQTKQLIQNFWKTDADGKITNEIELAMLDSWANGSEKVKMPTRGRELINKGSNPYDRKEVVFNYTSSSAIEGDRLTFDTYRVGDKYYDAASWCKKDCTRQDILIDKNRDGYADKRVYFEAKSRGEELGGLYDEKIVFEIEL